MALPTCPCAAATNWPTCAAAWPLRPCPSIVRTHLTITNGYLTTCLWSLRGPDLDLVLDLCCRWPISASSPSESDSINLGILLLYLFTLLLLPDLNASIALNGDSLKFFHLTTFATWGSANCRIPNQCSEQMSVCVCVTFSTVIIR